MVLKRPAGRREGATRGCGNELLPSQVLEWDHAGPLHEQRLKGVAGDFIDVLRLMMLANRCMKT